MAGTWWEKVFRPFAGSPQAVKPPEVHGSILGPVPLPQLPTNEDEWLETDSPIALLRAVRVAGRLSERKGRLTAVASVRLQSEAVLPEIEEALLLAERLADGLATEKERLAALRTKSIHNSQARHSLPHCLLNWSGVQSAFRVMAFQALDSCAAFHQIGPARRAAIGELIRDVFGNPFQSTPFAPDWRTTTCVSLAEGIYRQRAFERMPLLADALEEAGCDHADILEHCRGDGTHVRGCWVLDLVLDKS